jgi:nucleotide-binding universal stress UspA family protein
MSEPRCILVPIDLDEASSAARTLAASLAGAMNAELVLLGVAPEAVATMAAGPNGMPVPPIETGESERIIDRLAQDRLDEALDALPGGLRARSTLTWGPVGPAVIDAVHEQHADLVVLAMCRESGLAHLLGDRAQRHVLQHCSVPVVVVPAGAEIDIT